VSRQLAKHFEIEVMGTVVTIDLYTDASVPPASANAGFAGAGDILIAADEIFSTWKADSPMSRLRRGEITFADVPSEVVSVLEGCDLVRRMSRGWFDPWAMPGGVDPTGYVKGWAAQSALDFLKLPGINAAVVNAAGDIASFGGIGEKGKFRFGIVDPRSSLELACIVEITGSLATSGTYERGDHLRNPFSGQLAAAAASASVTGPDLAIADGLATAVAIAGIDGLEIIESLPEYEALIISKDGSHRWTPGFPFSIDGIH
jgi:thiamine biosynthesis lipoprotein